MSFRCPRITVAARLNWALDAAIMALGVAACRRSYVGKIVMAKPRTIAEAGRLGAVEAYAIARVAPDPGRLVTCSDVFADYRSWCDQGGLAPLREPQFTEAFEMFAREVGIPVRQRGSNLSFVDVTLADVQAS